MGQCPRNRSKLEPGDLDRLTDIHLYNTMKWVHNKPVIKPFQNVTTFRSYNLQMDNPHFSDIDEESAIINCLNPRDRKGSYKVWLWWKHSDSMDAKMMEIVQPKAVYKTGAIKSWVQKPY